MKAYFTFQLPLVAEELLAKAGIDFEVNRSGKILSKKSLIKKAHDCDALVTLLADVIDKEVIDNLPNCKVIANYAVGYNNIDVDYARSKGIVVTNTPGILTDATADLTMALILATARRIPEAEKFVREGKFKGWKPELLLGVDLKKKYLGIIGMGRIGFAVAERAKAFGMKILYYSRSPNIKAEEELGARKVSLNKLLKTSDFVSLHVPLTPKTKNLLSKERLELLKPTAILINTARGEVVDEKHLISMLRKKRILAAGFDVYENEPQINPQLLKLKNVVLLPHIGSATVETRSAMAELVARNVIAVLTGKKAITPV